MSETEKIYYTYIVRCEDNSLYTGITTDICRRFDEHFHQIPGKCARYTLSHKVISLEAVWQSYSRSQASRLEYSIKTLSKTEKEKLIIDNSYFDVYFGEKIESCNYLKLDNCSLNI